MLKNWALVSVETVLNNGLFWNQLTINLVFECIAEVDYSLSGESRYHTAIVMIECDYSNLKSRQVEESTNSRDDF